MCYDTDIRAKLFTQLQGDVLTLYDMRKVMGFNKFKEMPGLGACDVSGDVSIVIFTIFISHYNTPSYIHHT